MAGTNPVVCLALIGMAHAASRAGVLLPDPAGVARKPATTTPFWHGIASALLDWHGRMPRRVVLYNAVFQALPHLGSHHGCQFHGLLVGPPRIGPAISEPLAA